MTFYKCESMPKVKPLNKIEGKVCKMLITWLLTEECESALFESAKFEHRKIFFDRQKLKYEVNLFDANIKLYTDVLYVYYPTGT